MELGFDLSLADGYSSLSQRARRLSEGWFGAQMYCAACGDAPLGRYPNNAKANDFFCRTCGASFELKSGKDRLARTLADGAFDAMMARLEKLDGGPHLVYLRYCPTLMAVRDLTLVLAPFLTKDVIHRRRALDASARRAGWVGCNIRVGEIPSVGRVPVILDGAAVPRPQVVAEVRRVCALKGDLDTRTWLVDVLRCVERLGEEFDLAEVYAFEAELQQRHPANRNIRAKIRQQLQRLRDAGLLIFLERGRYRRVTRRPIL